MTAEHPEGWSPRPDRDAVERVLEEIEREAAEHSADYRAGMRHARLILEEETS